MRRHRLLVIAAAAFGVCAAAPDPVIAERGAEQITVSQARALLAAADPDSRHKLLTDQAALKDFLRNVLVQRAILAEALGQKWDQKPDVAALLARAHDQVVAQSFLAAHAELPSGFPSEAVVQAAYDQNKAQFMQPRGYRLVQLFAAKPAAGSVDDGKRRLATLRAQVDRGRLAFPDAARHDAGVQYLDMGWLTEKQLVPAVHDAVLGLPEGAMTAPVCVDNGCHVIKLLATRPAGPVALAEVHDALIRALRQQKQAELERAYASGLLAKQPVAIDEIQLSRMAP